MVASGLVVAAQVVAAFTVSEAVPLAVGVAFTRAASTAFAATPANGVTSTVTLL